MNKNETNTSSTSNTSSAPLKIEDLKVGDRVEYFHDKWLPGQVKDTLHTEVNLRLDDGNVVGHCTQNTIANGWLRRAPLKIEDLKVGDRVEFLYASRSFGVVVETVNDLGFVTIERDNGGTWKCAQGTLNRGELRRAAPVEAPTPKAPLTLNEIDTIQKIGRDEATRVTTIGLAELDALCETARFYTRVADARLKDINHLVEDVHEIRRERDETRDERQTYWKAKEQAQIDAAYAKSEVERVTKERDAERDRARIDLEWARKERDAARNARNEIRVERDQARAELARKHHVSQYVGYLTSITHQMPGLRDGVSFPQVTLEVRQPRPSYARGPETTFITFRLDDIAREELGKLGNGVEEARKERDQARAELEAERSKPNYGQAFEKGLRLAAEQELEALRDALKQLSTR